MENVSRRKFLCASAAFGAGSLLWPRNPTVSANQSDHAAPEICIFVKFLQSMSFRDLASALSSLEVSGIEATVRNGGQILPPQAEEKLPELVDALKKENLRVTIMASSINSVKSPHAESVLRTAAGLGIKSYRMDYYRYDLKKPVAPQVESFKAMAKDLAAMNKELGIQAVYQNHAGAGYVGASIWDLHQILGDIPKEQIGIAYDTRHSAVEAGMSWPVLWNLVQPHLGAVFVKNARWDGRTPRDIPLGETGVVDPKIFTMIRESGVTVPLSLHVEYLPKGDVPENLAAIRRDLQTLRELLS